MAPLELTPILQWLSLLKRSQQAGKSIAVNLQLSEHEPFIAAMTPKGLLPGLGEEADPQETVLRRVANGSLD